MYKVVKIEGLCEFKKKTLGELNELITNARRTQLGTVLKAADLQNILENY